MKHMASTSLVTVNSMHSKHSRNYTFNWKHKHNFCRHCSCKPSQRKRQTDRQRRISKKTHNGSESFIVSPGYSSVGLVVLCWDKNSIRLSNHVFVLLCVPTGQYWHLVHKFTADINSVIYFLFLSKVAMQLSLHKGRVWHKLSLSFNISCWHSPLPKKWLSEVPSICTLKKKKQ